MLGASVRSSTRGKGHEEGGSAYAKAGSSLRSPSFGYATYDGVTVRVDEMFRS